MARATLLSLTISQDPSIKDLERLFPGAQSLVTDLLVDISHTLEKDALAAFQTTVPVFTRQLRDQMIIAWDKNYKYRQGFEIYASGKVHTTSYGRNKPTGAKLAEILDSGFSEKNGMPLHRRKNAVPAFTKLSAPLAKTSTANWIGEAVDFVEKMVDELGS